MLSFITYELLKNPHAYAKVREEVDTVLQGKLIQPEHLSKLPYIVAVMREALRLHPPALILGKTPFEDTTLGGEYFIPKGTIVSITNAWLHRDPEIWGDDVSLRLETKDKSDTNIVRTGRELQTREDARWKVRDIAGIYHPPFHERVPDIYILDSRNLGYLLEAVQGHA
jgi:hypothetical protein